MIINMTNIWNIFFVIVDTLYVFRFTSTYLIIANNMFLLFYIPFIFYFVYKCNRIFFLLLCQFNVTFFSPNLLLKSICWWFLTKTLISWKKIKAEIDKSENLKRYLYWHIFLFSLIKVHRKKKKTEVYYGK